MRESSSHEIASHVKNFLTNSPQSVFASRLLFLDSILKDLKSNTASPEKRMASTLSYIESMLDHYSEILWENESQRVSAESKAQGPMRETNRILNWKFKSLVNLQMNVERLYRGVARCLKMQQDFTGQTVRQNLILRIEAGWREKSMGGFVNRVVQKIGEVGVDYQEESHSDEGSSTNEEDLFQKGIEEEGPVEQEPEGDLADKSQGKPVKHKSAKYTVKKSQLQDLIVNTTMEPSLGQSLSVNFRMMRHVSIRNMLKSFAISQFWVQTQRQATAITKEGELRFGKVFTEMKRRRPVYKNYFRGKQCLKSYLCEKMKALDKIKETKRSFKLRFVVDFVKGFRRLFEVSRTVNFHNLTGQKVINWRYYQV